MQNLNSMKNDGELSSNLESGEGQEHWVVPVVYIVVYTMLFLIPVALVVIPLEPWPFIWNKKALIQECAKWMEACKEAREKGESKPSMPPMIEKIDGEYHNYGCTRLEDDHVVIFVGEKDSSIFDKPVFDFATCFLVVFPLELDNPDYRPSPNFPCKPTWHPRIFKLKRTYKFDYTRSCYVEVTD